MNNKGVPGQNGLCGYTAQEIPLSVCRPQLVRIAEHSDSLLSCPRECTAVPPDSSPYILP